MKSNWQTITMLLIAALLTFGLVSWMNSYLNSKKRQELSYNEFVKMVDGGEVESIKIGGTEITVVPKKDNAKYSQDLGYYVVKVPGDYKFVDRFLENNVETHQENKDANTLLLVLLNYAVPFLFLLFLMNFTMKRMGGGGIMGVGKSNAKMYVQKETGVTFKDVAGEDEAKENLAEIVDYLHNPQKYTEAGASMPKGILLVGPPGTGKTMLAKAVAGESNVPFFSISGSEFVEMFVGMGASKVRDLFSQAKEKAPCIVFIDEIDAIGQKRNGGGYGGNDEREQTLNQLLTEMDGFEENTGVIILAATNRPESLDPALTRPGRFDRRVPVELPDLAGREAILKVHAKKIKLAQDVDFHTIARMAAGASGAELANIINEAALRAVRNGRVVVTEADLEESIETVIAGYQKKNAVLSDKEKLVVSYHEIGHALVAALQSDSAPVQKITIVPRTMGALGYVMQVPEEEKFLNTKKELKAMLVVSLAGRAAEEIVFDTVTTGAANDIEQATRVARAMVTQYGMSAKFGLMGLETQENQYLTGRTVMNCGDATAAEIDTEVMKMLKEAYAEAKRLLSENRDVMDKIAAFLIEKETITGKEFMKIFREVKGIPEPEDDHSRMGGESAETVESAENGNRQPEMAAGSEQPAAEQVQNPVQDGNSVMPQDPEQKTAETQNGQQGSDNGQGPAEL